MKYKLYYVLCLIYNKFIMNNISKDIIFYICNMLSLSDIKKFKLVSKKICNHIDKYMYKYMIYKYDNNFPETLYLTDINKIKFYDDFNQDILSLANSFPNLTNLHLGCCFDQDISSLANSFPNLTNL